MKQRRKISFTLPKGESLLSEILSEKPTIYENRVIYYNSTGKFHRANGPAVIYNSRKRSEWWIHGKLHRADGPAIIAPGRYEEWWLKGKPHREDGPAVVWVTGGTEYWRHGKLHRTDGPAVIHANGIAEYYRNGICINPPLDTHPRYFPEYDYTNKAENQ